MPGPNPILIELDDEKRHELLAMASGSSSQLSLRARIVLAAADGANNRQIAEQENTTDRTVRLWRSRYARRGLAGLHDKKRTGRKTPDINLTDAERSELQRYLRRAAIRQSLGRRARIVLLAAEGHNNLGNRRPRRNEQLHRRHLAEAFRGREIEGAG